MGLNEADTRAKLIDPVIHTLGWTEDLIRREITAGTIEIINGRTKRRQGKADYLLCLPIKGGTPLPIGVLEAKKEDEHATLGMDQAKEYAKYLNVPFIFSSNGHLFVKYDSFTGIVSEEISLEEFPAPYVLRKLYEERKGFTLDSKGASPLFVPYRGGQSERRYYQDAAIRATLEKIASKKPGWNRVLLSLATGSGKTRIAVQLLEKLAHSGNLRKALFVCDRNQLRKQAHGRLSNTFGDNVAIVENKNPQTNARFIVSTYQALGLDEDGDRSFFLQNYPKNYFSHIIIDECHRSAWDQWSLVLTNNPDAVQIGLTATPRKIKGAETFGKNRDEEITRNNIKYFGEPVYEYPYVKGWKDGYLAACEIVKRSVSIDDCVLNKKELFIKGARDAKTGQIVHIEDMKDNYQKTDYEKELILPDRRKAMCADLFEQLEKTGGPRQKTIIFCVNDKHAEDVTNELSNLYKAKGYPDCEKFAFKCTQKGISCGTLGEDQETLIANMKGNKNSHFIATTVDLLTTGVDIPCVQNIVFFNYVTSPISFYQMVGRGTRIEESFDKYMFRIYDYTNASDLFGEEFISSPKREPSTPKEEGKKRKITKVHGYQIEIRDKGKFILMQDEDTGKDRPVPVEEYKEKLAASLMEQVDNLDLLREMWVHPDDRKHLISALPGGESGSLLLRDLLNLKDCDLFDLFAEIGFGVPAKTRKKRVSDFAYKNEAWLMSLPSDSSEVIKALAYQFKESGIEELENPTIFNVPEIKKAGGIKALGKVGMNIGDLLTEVKMGLLAV